jgi:hypothetical protein
MNSIDLAGGIAPPIGKNRVVLRTILVCKIQADGLAAVRKIIDQHHGELGSQKLAEITALFGNHATHYPAAAAAQALFAAQEIARQVPGIYLGVHAGALSFAESDNAGDTEMSKDRGAVAIARQLLLAASSEDSHGPMLASVTTFALAGYIGNFAANDRQFSALNLGGKIIHYGGIATHTGQLEPPTRRLAGFRLGPKIGASLVCAVHLADDESRGGKVALKILDRRGRGKVFPRDRFFHQAALLAAIEHPHIVRIVDHGVADGAAYIAMEHLDGGDLGQLMRTDLTVAQSVSLLRQAAIAVGEIHRHGIVHRDIKPENFLLRRSGLLVLADLGSATKLGQELLWAKRGTIVGTPAYAAPEQCDGAVAVPNADIYSLGVIFYEMLCGHRPFDGETIVELLSQHHVAPVPRLPLGMQRFQSLLDAMMHKDPQQRMANAACVIQTLDQIESRPEPIPVQPDVDGCPNLISTQ